MYIILVPLFVLVEAAGVKSILVPKDRSVRINEVVMKTSAGAFWIGYVLFLVSNLCEALKKLQKQKLFCLFFFYGWRRL